MQISIQARERFTDSCVGSLMVDSVFECFTHEPPIRADRLFVPGESALPAGRYNLSIEYSKRFQQYLPLLAGTGPAGDRRASRLGMWIHPGHPREETFGTMLLGARRSEMNVRGTRDAFKPFMEKCTQAKIHGLAIDVEIL